MSAHARYTILLKNTVAIYAAAEENRATLLHTGLNDIVTGVGPTRPADWDKVRMDSAILLRIWATKEANEAANEVQQQLLAFLNAQAVAPSIHIMEPAIRSNNPMLHIKEYPSDDDDDVGVHKVVIIKQPTPPTPAPSPAPAPAPKVNIKPVEPEEESEEEEEEESEEESEEEEEEEEEVEEEKEEEKVEEEEEEAEAEVEPITLRGRKYWLDKNSNTLYANEEGDEVGEEVGALRDGKPVFLVK